MELWQSHPARRLEDARLASTQAGVRSFIITFDVYVIVDIFEKYDNKRPDPCLRFDWVFTGYGGDDDEKSE